VALYHLSVKPVSRGDGRSAVACAAYRSADELHDERQGVVHDYTRKQGVEETLLLAPAEAAWARQDRAALWNAAEAAEKRKDARVAREYELALPCEMDAAGRRALVEAFAGELVERYGVAVDAAIHAPGREGDQRNWHAHVLTTTRRAEASGLGEKAGIELSDTARAKLGLGKAADEIEGLRAVWGGVVNRALERARVAERVDHRSYTRQGRGEVLPMQHAGPAVCGLERKAERRRQAAEAQARQEREQEAAEQPRPEPEPEPEWAGMEVPAAAAAATGPALPVSEQLQEGEDREGRERRRAAEVVPEPVEGAGPAPEPRTPHAAQDGPRTAGEGRGGQGAVFSVSTTGPELDRPVRASAGVYGVGPEPVTRVGQRNAEIQERNRLVEAARRAAEQAQRVLERLERAARAGVAWVRGLAHGLGAQVVEAQRTREREIERQRQERERLEVERRAELERREQARLDELRRQEVERDAPRITQAQRDASRARAAASTSDDQERQRARQAEAPRQSRGMGFGR
jgi:hypothetical protein